MVILWQGSNGVFLVQIINGKLQQARQVASPNCDERPDARDISLLVIHNISLPPDNFDPATHYVEQFFTNQLPIGEHPFFKEIKDLRVSAHLYIRRSGEVVQFVNLNQRAWHAGVSEFEGRSACNDFSMGIELEGNDVEAYTNSQYTALASVTKAMLLEYHLLTPERITGHCDIAPGRKTDPGQSFEWSRYARLLKEDG